MKQQTTNQTMYNNNQPNEATEQTTNQIVYNSNQPNEQQTIN